MLNKIDFKLLVFLIIGFFVFTVLGILSHEMGHYLCSKLLNIPSILHYNSTEILNYKAINSSALIWIAASGPMLSIFIGTIGLISLFSLNKKALMATHLSSKQFFFIFLTFFWSRPVFNLVKTTLLKLIEGVEELNMDEIYIALYFNLPMYTFLFPLAVIGLIILSFVFIKFIPNQQKLIFLCAGIMGSALGLIIWLNVAGPKLFP